MNSYREKVEEVLRELAWEALESSSDRWTGVEPKYVDAICEIIEQGRKDKAEYIKQEFDKKFTLIRLDGSEVSKHDRKLFTLFKRAALHFFLPYIQPKEDKSVKEKL